MFELLQKSFTDKASISPQELQEITAAFSPKKLRKRQYLLQEGDVCKRLAFVAQGALLSYSIDTKGTQGVLIIGSGNMVHNLGMVAWDKLSEVGHGNDWALQMNSTFMDLIGNGNHDQR